MAEEDDFVDECGGGTDANFDGNDDVANEGPQDLSSLFTMVSVSEKDDPRKLKKRTLNEYQK